MELSTINLLQLLVGIFLGLLISLAAWRVGALSTSGAAAAAITGALIFGLGGVSWAVLLLLFFVSSTAFSRAFKRRKNPLIEKFSKGSRRDWAQVLANGGLGAGLVVVQVLVPTQIWPWVAFAGAMAAVNADTWATELGVLNSKAPRLITNWRPVEKGTSGGISLLGSLAAFAGGSLVAFGAAVFSIQAEAMVILGLFISVAAAGFTGALVDSYLGATLQGIFWCADCKKETERYPLHTCGSITTCRRGFTWLNNDWVNFACSASGAASAALFYFILFQ
jgi:uncharacterized protein (TIGR00297 family)